MTPKLLVTPLNKHELDNDVKLVECKNCKYVKTCPIPAMFVQEANVKPEASTNG